MSNLKRQRGATIIEMIITMSLMLGVISGAAYWYYFFNNTNTNAVVAGHMKLIGEAGSRYIANNPAVFSTATATSPVLLTVDTLVSANYLSNTVSKINAYNQSMCIVVLQPSAGNYAGLLVTEGGTTIDGPLLGEIASRLELPGGAVYTRNLTRLQGTRNGWSLPLPTAYQNTNNAGMRCDGTPGAVTLTVGHPVMALWITAAATTNQAVLHRNVVPGQPQLNQMNTPLVMNATAVPGSACTSSGAIAQNSNTTGLVECGSNGVWNVVGNVVSGIASGTACSESGRLGTTPTGVAYICNGSYWAPMQNFGNPGAACPTEGEMAVSIPTSESLVCKNSKYVRLVSLINKNIMISRQVVTDGVVVPKPTCDVGGAPTYSYEMIQASLDIGVAPPRQLMYLSASDNGASWTIQIRVKDQNGGDFSAGYLNVQALFKPECMY